MIADDEDELEGLFDEIEAMEAPMAVILAPTTVLQLVGLLQVALRCPSVSTEADAFSEVRQFIDAAREYFADCPMVLKLIQRGDDAREDGR